MMIRARHHNPFLAALAAIFFAAAPLWAQTATPAADLAALLEQLKVADADQAEKIEQEIWLEWSKSGSDAMDLLLARGRKAMAEGAPEMAVQHLTALVDHAPGFAEGWNARATAYYQLGEFGPAIADIARTLSLNPNHFGALAGLGSIFEELGAQGKARAAYLAAQAINPQNKGLSDALARLDRADTGQDL
jgi:tetratricopeptide (TPR) repeat protein